jgi:hypothetical protein
MLSGEGGELAPHGELQLAAARELRRRIFCHFVSTKTSICDEMIPPMCLLIAGAFLPA